MTTSDHGRADHELDCDRACLLITAAEHGALSDDEERALDRHLAGCALCTETMAAITVGGLDWPGLLTADLEPPRPEPAPVAQPALSATPAAVIALSCQPAAVRADDSPVVAAVRPGGIGAADDNRSEDARPWSRRLASWLTGLWSGLRARPVYALVGVAAALAMLVLLTRGQPAGAPDTVTGPAVSAVPEEQPEPSAAPQPDIASPIPGSQRFVGPLQQVDMAGRPADRPTPRTAPQPASQPAPRIDPQRVARPEPAPGPRRPGSKQPEPALQPRNQIDERATVASGARAAADVRIPLVRVELDESRPAAAEAPATATTWPSGRASELDIGLQPLRVPLGVRNPPVYPAGVPPEQATPRDRGIIRPGLRPRSPVISDHARPSRAAPDRESKPTRPSNTARTRPSSAVRPSSPPRHTKPRPRSPSRSKPAKTRTPRTQ
ncbi:MAG: hypothetical protein AAGC55_00655 [Myxococcota bacterium]